MERGLLGKIALSGHVSGEQDPIPSLAIVRTGMRQRAHLWKSKSVALTQHSDENDSTEPQTLALPIKAQST